VDRAGGAGIDAQVDGIWSVCLCAHSEPPSYP
jgi:hypothetical protein